MSQSDSEVWVNPETGGVESTPEWRDRLAAGDPEAHRQLAALAAPAPEPLGMYSAEVRSGGAAWVHQFTERSVRDVLSKLAELVDVRLEGDPFSPRLTIEIRRHP